MTNFTRATSGDDWAGADRRAGQSADAPGTPADARAGAVADSFRHCEQVTRRCAKNFYYGLKLLPEPKRSAMYALYAYMRGLDDIADADPSDLTARDITAAHRPAGGGADAQRLADLEAWRVRTSQAVAGTLPDAAGGPTLWPAFAHAVRRHHIPPRLFDDAIAGQLQDLHAPCFPTFDDLATYCYRVAGVVGVASLHIWGFEGGAAAEELAVRRGLAFQLTNILRDVREDAARGRAYLPRDEMLAAGVAEADLFAGRATPGFAALARRLIDRAEAMYQASVPLEGLIEPDSRPTLVAMTAIYHGLLKKIARRPERVLRQRVSLSLWTKLRIAWRAARARP